MFQQDLPLFDKTQPLVRSALKIVLFFDQLEPDAEEARKNLLA
jgi:hypothetical protein